MSDADKIMEISKLIINGGVVTSIVQQDRYVILNETAEKIHRDYFIGADLIEFIGQHESAFGIFGISVKQFDRYLYSCYNGKRIVSGLSDSYL